MARSFFVSALATVVALSLVRPGVSDEEIAWRGDLRTAQESAAREGKLVLLHFYSDHCRPCKTLERNVLSQAEIAAAVNRNYVPVKVHVDSTPQLAQRYHVEAWPTDLILTPTGLEVFRTISPQSPTQYLTMLDQVAFQAGVGAGRQQLAGPLHSPSRHDGRGDVSLTAGTSPAGQVTSGASFGSTTPPTTPPRAQPFGQGSVSTWPAPSSSAANDNPYATPQAPANRYGGQGIAQRQAAPLPTSEAPYVGGAPFPPPAADRWAGPTATQRGSQTTIQNSIYADPQDQPAVSAPPARGAQQRWAAGPGSTLAPEPVASIYERSPAPQLPAQRPTYNPAISPGPSAQQTSSQFRSPQFVEVSRAPPVALDGFCPVTIRESTKWHKGNVRYGAVHRNRTYLFASAEAQRKFLADPERYAPVLSGCDPVVFVETNQFIDGNHNIGLLMGGQTFFFVSEENLTRFKLSPQAYLGRAYQAMSAGLRPR